MTFPGLPAQRQVMFDDGNSRPALDPHDARSLRAARHHDPVVLSSDTTLGQKKHLGFAAVPVVAIGGACAAVAVGCVLALVTGAVHGGGWRFLLAVVALAAVVPAVRILPDRFWHRDSAIAISHAGLTVRHRGRELHLAWVEIGRVRVEMTYHRRQVHSPPEVLAGRTRVQARSQIRLAPATPGSFDKHASFGTHKGARLLRKVWHRPDEKLVSARIAYSHAIPLRHRRLVEDDHLPEPVMLVDAALHRFAGDRYAPPKVTRRHRPFLW